MDSRYKELETLISKFVRTLPEGVEYEKRSNLNIVKQFDEITKK